MSILRKRIIHKPQDYYKDSVRYTQGKYHGWVDQWDGGPRNGWTDAYNGHSSRLSIHEQRDTLIEDYKINNEKIGKHLTKTDYVCDGFVTEDSTEEELWDSEDEESDSDNRHTEDSSEDDDSSINDSEEEFDDSDDSDDSEDNEEEFADSEDSDEEFEESDDSEEEFEDIEL